jgi:hypothetical protein
MPTSLTSAERSARARLAAYEMHAQHDPKETTAAARAASPARVDYFLKQVPTDLPDPERLRRAEYLRKAHFQRLALASMAARRRRRQQQETDGSEP